MSVEVGTHSYGVSRVEVALEVTDDDAASVETGTALVVRLSETGALVVRLCVASLVTFAVLTPVCTGAVALRVADGMTSSSVAVAVVLIEPPGRTMLLDTAGRDGATADVLLCETAGGALVVTGRPVGSSSSPAEDEGTTTLLVALTAEEGRTMDEVSLRPGSGASGEAVDAGSSVAVTGPAGRRLLVVASVALAPAVGTPTMGSVALRVLDTALESSSLSTAEAVALAAADGAATGGTTAVMLPSTPVATGSEALERGADVVVRGTSDSSEACSDESGGNVGAVRLAAGVVR